SNVFANFTLLFILQTGEDFVQVRNLMGTSQITYLPYKLKRSYINKVEQCNPNDLELDNYQLYFVPSKKEEFIDYTYWSNIYKSLPPVEHYFETNLKQTKLMVLGQQKEMSINSIDDPFVYIYSQILQPRGKGDSAALRQNWEQLLQIIIKSSSTIAHQIGKRAFCINEALDYCPGKGGKSRTASSSKVTKKKSDDYSVYTCCMECQKTSGCMAYSFQHGRPACCSILQEYGTEKDCNDCTAGTMTKDESLMEVYLRLDDSICVKSTIYDIFDDVQTLFYTPKFEDLFSNYSEPKAGWLRFSNDSSSIHSTEMFCLYACRNYLYAVFQQQNQCRCLTRHFQQTKQLSTNSCTEACEPGLIHENKLCGKYKSTLRLIPNQFDKTKEILMKHEQWRSDQSSTDDAIQIACFEANDEHSQIKIDNTTIDFHNDTRYVSDCSEKCKHRRYFTIKNVQECWCYEDFLEHGSRLIKIDRDDMAYMPCLGKTHNPYIYGPWFEACAVASVKTGKHGLCLYLNLKNISLIEAGCYEESTKFKLQEFPIKKEGIEYIDMSTIPRDLNSPLYPQYPGYYAVPAYWRENTPTSYTKDNYYVKHPFLTYSGIDSIPRLLFQTCMRYCFFQKTPLFAIREENGKMVCSCGQETERWSKNVAEHTCTCTERCIDYPQLKCGGCFSKSFVDRSGEWPQLPIDKRLGGLFTCSTRENEIISIEEAVDSCKLSCQKRGYYYVAVYARQCHCGNEFYDFEPQTYAQDIECRPPQLVIQTHYEAPYIIQGLTDMRNQGKYCIGEENVCIFRRKHAKLECVSNVTIRDQIDKINASCDLREEVLHGFNLEQFLIEMNLTAHDLHYFNYETDWLSMAHYETNLFAYLNPKEILPRLGYIDTIIKTEGSFFEQACDIPKWIDKVITMYKQHRRLVEPMIHPRKRRDLFGNVTVMNSSIVFRPLIYVNNNYLLHDYNSVRTIFSDKLMISSVDWSHAGIYECRQLMSNGITYRWPFLLSILYKPQWIELNKEKNVAVKVGSNYELNCDVRGHPVPTIKWYFKHDIHGTRLAKEWHEIQSSGYYYRILDAQYSHSGLYRCNLESKYLSNKLSREFIVTIYDYYPQEPQLLAREFINPIQKWIGQSLMRVCLVQSTHNHPFFLQTRFHPRHPRYARRWVSTNNMINITTVDFTHEGIYSCEATNSYSTKVWNFTVHVYAKEL
ncbi:unnamed protein product, partial [Didymodactylos carnosus]